MPYLFLALAACFWGGNYVIGHLLVSDADPIILSQLRWLVTAVLLMSLYFKQVKQQWASMKEAKGIILFLSLCGQVLFPVTLYIGLQYTSALNAAIYMSATPSIVLLINAVVFKEKINKRNYFGVVLSTLGVIYLVFRGNLNIHTVTDNLNKGDLWAICSAVSWALYCAFLRLKPRTVNGNAFVAVSSVIGSLILLPILIYHLYISGSVADYNNIDAGHYISLFFLAGLAYLVIFPSWLSYLLWNKGILTIGATRGEIFSHLIPLSGGFFGIIFLNESLQSFHLLSAVLIISGIYFCSTTRK
ncbi:MAG TPA: EamA/RhaT family transporter [Morganella sp. (in: Bacteria)]|nr:EamA/RhaT family transporter [Morganella sp. (in: enterobacteria)]